VARGTKQPDVEDAERELVDIIKQTLLAVSRLTMHRSRVVLDVKRLRDHVRHGSSSRYKLHRAVGSVKRKLVDVEGIVQGLQDQVLETQVQRIVLGERMEAAYASLVTATETFEKSTAEFWTDYDKWYAEPGESSRLRIRKRRKIEEMPKRISKLEAKVRILEREIGHENEV